MGSGDNVLGIDESTTAGVDRLLGVLLQNGHMPWVLAELTVSIHVDGVLDATGDSGGVPHNGSAQFIRLSETPTEHKVFQVAESRLRFLNLTDHGHVMIFIL